MSKLPKAKCACCGRQVALRRTGEFWEHQPALNGPAAFGKCAGSGVSPVAAERRWQDHLEAGRQSRTGVS